MWGLEKTRRNCNMALSNLASLPDRYSFYVSERFWSLFRFLFMSMLVLIRITLCSSRSRTFIKPKMLRLRRPRGMAFRCDVLIELLLLFPLSVTTDDVSTGSVAIPTEASCVAARVSMEDSVKAVCVDSWGRESTKLHRHMARRGAIIAEFIFTTFPFATYSA